eukprot:1158420-Pelagomonas_calceolata.AAC.1
MGVGAVLGCRCSAEHCSAFRMHSFCSCGSEPRRPCQFAGILSTGKPVCSHTVLRASDPPAISLVPGRGR